MASLQKVLKQLQKVWTETEPQEVGRISLPDGNYKGDLVNARVELSKSSERLQVAWEIKVTEPEKHAKKSVTKFDGLDNELSISWAKGTMNLLGMEVPEDFAELPDTFEEFFKKNKSVPIAFTVKSEEGFTNIYFNAVEEEGTSTGTKKKSSKVKEEEEEEEEKPKKKGKSPDLDDMDIKELLDYASENDITVPKTIKESPKRVRNYIKELLEG